MSNGSISPKIHSETHFKSHQSTPRNAFSSPPTPDALIKFVNDLGYSKVVRTLLDVVTNDMFQPWRALTTVINLCLTGKTSDKKNLAQHTQGKKKGHTYVIRVLGFTKLIVYYLQSKHKFHPRPGSPLHLPNEEPVLGYLKFSAKGTKREVFGMPIRWIFPHMTFKLVDEFVDEGVLENEPMIGDEDADLQKAVEESLKEFHSARQGPLPPVVIREPESGKFQPLLEHVNPAECLPAGVAQMERPRLGPNHRSSQRIAFRRLDRSRTMRRSSSPHVGNPLSYQAHEASQ
ncbi:retrovirus-related pol polyprotein from transposon TNT 1-94 [Tanacetum coccineum]|uniref:Retrovirus-related pol polyprotein from transposon TNT 1-94 n=1 Tax=Tanacetum coccineum TaxID=301880 RepID=A0ABQ5HRS3_9ASTR